MASARRILFICPHGAAKSVIAAAYFRREAAQRGMQAEAASAGTEPDDAVPAAVVDALRAEGITFSNERPQQVTGAMLAAADHIVSLGANLDGMIPPGVAVERWDNLPLVSENVDIARAAIRSRVIGLLDVMERP